MTIALRSAHGTAQNKTAGTSRIHTVSTANVLAGDTALFGCASDNLATADGVSNDHTSVTDTQGNVWEKVGEYTNTVGGAAGDGVTVSLWKCEVTTDLVITTDTVTINFSGSITAKVVGLISYSHAAGMELFNDGYIAVTRDAATGSPSKTLSGLANVQHLFFACDAFETTQTSFGLTQDTDYTNQWNNGTTGSTAQTNCKLMGAHRLATLTGDTHQSTQSLTCDSVGILASFIEQAPPVTTKQSVGMMVA